MILTSPALWLFAILLTDIRPVSTSTTAFQLRPEIEVDGEGVFLHQIVMAPDGTALPSVRLADAPNVGIPWKWSRTQVLQRIQTALPTLGAVEWSGALEARLSRRSRVLTEAELLSWLKQTLEAQQVRGRGDLEIKLARPWVPISVPDDPADFKLVDIPSTGLSPAFPVRITLGNGRENFGNWPLHLQAKLWREIPVAATSLTRGETPSPQHFALEKVDLLVTRGALLELPSDLSKTVVAEPAMPGKPITARTLRPRPVIKRGQLIDAKLTQGALAILLKVEAMEDGIPGQLVRIRNPQSRKELRGRIKDEFSIEVVL